MLLDDLQLHEEGPGKQEQGEPVNVWNFGLNLDSMDGADPPPTCTVKASTLKVKEEPQDDDGGGAGVVTPPRASPSEQVKLLTDKVSQLSERMIEMKEDFQTQLNKQAIDTHKALADHTASTDSKFERMFDLFKTQMSALAAPRTAEPPAFTGPPAMPSLADALPSAESSYGPAQRKSAGAATGPYGVRNEAEESRTVNLDTNSLEDSILYGTGNDGALVEG